MFEDICRLCCSRKFVTNCIFDADKALHHKMSLYLPIKVLRDDKMPKKICDKCCCKVNDIYQFCNKVIKVQDRLRSLLLIGYEEDGDESVDVIDSKDNILPELQEISYCNQSVLTDPDNNAPQADNSIIYKITFDTSVKEEQKSPSSSPVHNEDDEQCSIRDFNNVDSDSSEDMILADLRTKKGNKGLHLKNGRSINNNEVDKKKQPYNNNQQAVDLDTYNAIDNPVKEEQKSPSSSPTHNEDNEQCKTYDFNNIDSDSSDDMILADVKTIKIKNEQLQLTNGKSVNNNEVENQNHNPGEPVFEWLRRYKDPDIRCCICFRRYNKELTMLTHYRNHVKNMDTLVGTQSVPPPLDPESPVCMLCKAMVAPGQWERHWRHLHPRPKWRPYRCLICARSFHTVDSIFQHGKLHDRFYSDKFRQRARKGVKCYPCDLCPDSFTGLYPLLWHRGRAHPREAYRDPVPHCAHCRAYFNTLRSLCRHLLQHVGPSNLCNFCGKTFAGKHHLKTHVLRIHQGVKSNVCKVCKKAFTTKHDLVVHERVHTGERPYVCGECGRGFTQKSALVVHKRSHTGERPYVCPRCGRGFVSRGLLTMHLKKACSPPQRRNDTDTARTAPHDRRTKARKARGKR